MQQQFCIKWNNHMKNFQSTLPKVGLNFKGLNETRANDIRFDCSISKIKNSSIAIFWWRDNI